MRCANNLQKCGLENLGREAAHRAERADASRKLSRAAAFCLFFMLVEVVGGLYANSLAVLTDAAHLLTDIAGFAISLFAIWATSWESTAIQSYGFFRLEILGALVSIQFIWLMTGMLLYEATGRLVDSGNDAVDGKVMFVVATLGLFVNIIMIAVLGHDGHSHDLGGHEHHEAHDHQTGEEVDIRNRNGGGRDHHEHHENHGHDDESTEHAPIRAYSEHDKHEHVENASHKSKAKGSHDTSSSAKTTSSHRRRPSNINVEGAYLHVLGDLIQSIGVMMGGAAIWYNPEWKVIDLICTLLFSVLVLFTTIQMLRDVLSILMESTPREVDAREVKRGLQELPGVVTVHELHIWAITMGKTLLTCHIRVLPDANHDEILTLVTSYLESCYHISHATIQVESDNT